MKYTVIWKPRALQALADIWLAANDKDSVNQAVSRIDAYLQTGGPRARTHFAGTLLLVAPPLVVVYEMSDDDCLATVLRVAYRP
jgi:plasmid stabilization system protein ParE